jgi:hypothetical protein
MLTIPHHVTLNIVENRDFSIGSIAAVGSYANHTIHRHYGRIYSGALPGAIYRKNVSFDYNLDCEENDADLHTRSDKNPSKPAILQHQTCGGYI